MIIYSYYSCYCREHPVRIMLKYHSIHQKCLWMSAYIVATLFEEPMDTRKRSDKEEKRIEEWGKGGE